MKRSSSFVDVEQLSDEEKPDVSLSTPVRLAGKGQTQSGTKRRRCIGLGLKGQQVMSPLKLDLCTGEARQRLWNVVRSSCKCVKWGRHRNCFGPFRDQKIFHELQKLVARLKSMDKMEMDREARWVWWLVSVLGRALGFEA